VQQPEGGDSQRLVGGEDLLNTVDNKGHKRDVERVRDDGIGAEQIRVTNSSIGTITLLDI